MSEETLAQTIIAMKERIILELEVGGDRESCPFCGHPRCQRSDYVRCVRCGINWLEGEDLGHDPSIERHAALLTSIAAQPKSTKPQ